MGLAPILFQILPPLFPGSDVLVALFHGVLVPDLV